MDQPLLSDLCAICLVEKPIYRCPRCKSRTCSLSCYKKHQQRASCNGKRDPTTYVKKAQWATPAGIDQDYNYLKGVERNIEDASQDVVQRGIGADTRQKSKVATRGWQAGSEFQKYLIENRITIQQAPKGMSRERTNHSRTTKGGNVFWTIEWVDDAGTRDIQHDCLSTMSIAELDAMRWTQKRNTEKRRLNAETSNHGTKRKRQHTEKGPATEAELASSGESASKLITEDRALSTPEVNNVDDKARAAPISEMQSDDANHDNHTEDPQKRGISNAASSSVHFIPENEATEEPSTPLSEPAPQPPDQATLAAGPPSLQLCYYLLKPATAGTARVLIPLDSRTSITDCLRDQVLQEYPTVYVLQHAPENLPEGFMLSEQYDASTTSKSGQLPDNRTNSGGQVKNSGQLGSDVRNAAAQLDPNSILQMLKRDISL